MYLKHKPCYHTGHSSCNYSLLFEHMAVYFIFHQYYFGFCRIKNDKLNGDILGTNHPCILQRLKMESISTSPQGKYYYFNSIPYHGKEIHFRDFYLATLTILIFNLWNKDQNYIVIYIIYVYSNTHFGVMFCTYSVPTMIQDDTGLHSLPICHTNTDYNNKSASEVRNQYGNLPHTKYI